jgi:hypothetical protein
MTIREAKRTLNKFGYKVIRESDEDDTREEIEDLVRFYQKQYERANKFNDRAGDKGITGSEDVSSDIATRGEEVLLNGLRALGLSEDDIDDFEVFDIAFEAVHSGDIKWTVSEFMKNIHR